MNLQRIDLNLFLVFETVYAQRTVTRAAEILNITQPAVSNALARLRTTFDDALFVRSGREMAPTPVAQNLIGPVRQALRQLQSSVDQRARFDPASAQKTFHLAMRDSSASALLPRLASTLRKVAPQVKLQCHPLDRQAITLELASGKLDFAVDIPQPGRTELRSVRLGEDRYVCVLRKGHPLARRPLTLARYLALDHVTTSGRRTGRSLIEMAVNRLGEQLNAVLRLPHFQPAFHVIMATDLVLAAPESLARQYDVLIRKLPFEAPVLESCLHWHRDADQDPASLWMRNVIARAAASAGPRAPS